MKPLTVGTEVRCTQPGHYYLREGKIVEVKTLDVNHVDPGLETYYIIDFGGELGPGHSATVLEVIE